MTSMNRIICQLLFLLFAGTIAAGMTLNPRYTYLFKLQLPLHSRGLEGWCMLYKGELYMLQGGVVPFTEKCCTFPFSIVITQDIAHGTCPLSSGLHYNALKDDQPVKWFDVTLIFCDDAWQWKVVELTKEQMPKILPHHAIIFLCDPAVVAEVTVPKKVKYCLDGSCEGGRCTFEMPTIVLDGTPEQLEAAHKCAHLSLPEVGIHHQLKRRHMQCLEGIYCCIERS